MASLQKKGDSWYCQFIYAKKRRTFTIGPVEEKEALQWQSRTETLLMRLEQGLLHVPRGVSIADFILHDGKPPVADPANDVTRETTLHELREAYLTTFGNGAIEKNTLYTARIHLNHLEETYGKTLLLAGLTLGKLQQHVNRRQKLVSAITIKKEIDTFRSVWHWGLRMKWVDMPFPSSGIVYPKTDEKLPFMSWDEIQRRIKAGGDAETLYECLYLDTAQISKMLTHVKNKKAPAWVYPMVLMAAHTGARRSELIRVRVEDIDLDQATLTIREKKRAKGARTTRRVPISTSLASVLKTRMKEQKGKPFLFGPGDQPLSVQSVHKAFERVLEGSKWSVIRGFHVLRHSMISACAMNNVDQRMLQEWVGHQTAAMQRRYTHLYPSAQKDALSAVFG